MINIQTDGSDYTVEDIISLLEVTEDKHPNRWWTFNQQTSYCWRKPACKYWYKDKVEEQMFLVYTNNIIKKVLYHS